MEYKRTLIWHDAAEEPQTDDCILVCIDDYCERCVATSMEWAYDVVAMEWAKDNFSCWDDFVCFYNVVKWCYISDLENL